MKYRNIYLTCMDESARHDLIGKFKKVGLRAVDSVAPTTDLIVAGSENPDSDGENLAAAALYKIPVVPLKKFIGVLQESAVNTMFDLAYEARALIVDDAANREVAETKQSEGLKRIQFTGFDDSQKSGLFSAAEKMGFRVMKGGAIPKNLSLLVTGPNPGLMKLRDAEDYGITVISLEDFGKMANESNIDLTSELNNTPPLPENSSRRFFGKVAKRRLTKDDISMSIVGTPETSSKAALFRLAEKAGMFIYGYGATFPKSLSILVVGDDPGTVLLERARKNGARIMSPIEFVEYANELIDAGGARNAKKDIKEPENLAHKKPASIQTALAEFKLIVEALACDHRLAPEEFTYLCEWLRKNDDLTETKEMKLVFDLAASILEDDTVTDKELNSMLKFLEKWTEGPIPIAEDIGMELEVRQNAKN